jgi:hypothetical protein
MAIENENVVRGAETKEEVVQAHARGASDEAE